MADGGRRVRPGAEPFAFRGGQTGVLLLHGFSGSPASMRPLGESLAGHGLTVACPLLAGHGGSAADLGRATQDEWVAGATDALDELAAACRTLFVAGLSMGAAMALHLAASRPERLAGAVAINPYLRDRRILLAPLLRLFVPSVKGVGNDIKKPGQDEVCNARIPIRALAELSALLRVVVAELPRVTAPLLVMVSTEDHVAPKGNGQLVIDRVASADREFVRLTNSYHVATLDFDAPEIEDRVFGFTDRLSGGA